MEIGGSCSVSGEGCRIVASCAVGNRFNVMVRAAWTISNGEILKKFSNREDFQRNGGFVFIAADCRIWNAVFCNNGNGGGWSYQ